MRKLILFLHFNLAPDLIVMLTWSSLVGITLYLKGVHGCTCDVDPFYPYIGAAKKVPIVYSEVAYTCPYTQETYVLIARNALYVPSIDNNFIPRFILWEAGVNVCDTTKIHLSDL